jgi:hypothetical protein
MVASYPGLCGRSGVDRSQYAQEDPEERSVFGLIRFGNLFCLGRLGGRQGQFDAIPRGAFRERLRGDRYGQEFAAGEHANLLPAAEPAGGRVRARFRKSGARARGNAMPGLVIIAKAADFEDQPGRLLPGRGWSEVRGGQ